MRRIYTERNEKRVLLRIVWPRTALPHDAGNKQVGTMLPQAKGAKENP
jgi:hypothetical protein